MHLRLALEEAFEDSMPERHLKALDASEALKVHEARKQGGYKQAPRHLHHPSPPRTASLSRQICTAYSSGLHRQGEKHPPSSTATATPSSPPCHEITYCMQRKLPIKP